ncbi:hypothetical protein EJ02DRAFT_452030 [Clathrospora elynae]|uniref:Uncharacterized protein n=1 Tax=Clathrospora elynae TaxID=706981 RepID=A0A6A5SXE2_9PLEO|nr:hypothetical protein EJ02DRAFT_452030 [Clathrospora elynae]
MAPIKELRPQRKPSLLAMSSLSRSTSLAPPDGLRPPTPGSTNASTLPHGRRHTGFRKMFDKLREPEAQFEMLMPPSSSPAPTLFPPQTMRLAKAFADSLDATQLSNFLTWMMYYDVVEIPGVRETWYKHIKSMEMCGWVALGDFLAKSLKSGSSYGFDLIVLDAICDRINLHRATVHMLLIQFADPAKMAFTMIATTIKNAHKEGCSALEALEAVQARLHELHKLTVNLKPQEGTKYDDWHAIIQKRLRGFLHLVIGPRIAQFRSGKPLITAATSDRLLKEVADGINLNYLYEAMQHKRKVPLARYGFYSGSTPQGFLTPPSSSLVADSDETERARNYAFQLMAENRDLCAQVAALQHDKEKLAQKLATLGRLQPTGYLGSNSENDRPITAPDRLSIDSDDQPLTLQVPQARPRPRSLSHDVGEKLATELDKKLHIINHQRQHSEVISWKYEDVFSGLKFKPFLALRLSDPVTGKLLSLSTPTTPVIPDRHPSRPASYAPNRSRRSGMIFNRASMTHLVGLGESTPRVQEENEDTGYDAVTPTPVERRHLGWE